MKTRHSCHWHVALLFGVGAALAMGSCRQDSAPREVLSGPSELALSLHMTANPDLVVTNGTASIGVSVRDTAGRPVANQAVFFTMNAGPGRLDRSVVVTDANGGCSVTYIADGGPGVADIMSRPIGLDFSGTDVFRHVTVEVEAPL